MCLCNNNSYIRHKIFLFLYFQCIAFFILHSKNTFALTKRTLAALQDNDCTHNLIHPRTLFARPPVTPGVIRNTQHLRRCVGPAPMNLVGGLLPLISPQPLSQPFDKITMLTFPPALLVFVIGIVLLLGRGGTTVRHTAAP